ncbi:fungal-specific transcription factor domain-containing protein [Apodospora peruviana]|uniref:Fungal-specific transcription factor domain-containing protein n=1 Tax=Apodospora peruviana TaxID=516989 RepID=A0AAE0IEH5_9PEZI|nr:fungal-specific transcription factor domain-containing protein [Apodospora peruviana]
MERNLPPRAERRNDEGACWTCLDRNWQCDGGLPRCRVCTQKGTRCRGYGIRMQWPAAVARTSRQRRRRQDGQQHRHETDYRDDVAFPGATAGGSLSALGLPSEDSFFMQHYIQNIARIALAIDYTGNGYRSLLPMAMQEPALLNGILAVAASHHSRWQHTADKASRRYLGQAAKALRDRFSTPNLVHDQVTLASMLHLVSFEVFSGSSRWRGHYDAIRGWIRSRGNCADLDPFLKTWVCLLDTQSALNLGEPAMPELEPWLALDDSTAGTGENQYVDALFGCSSRLPKLMWAAARLYASSRDNQTPPDEVRSRVDALQNEIRSTAIILDSRPLVGISCRNNAVPFATVGMGEEELRRRMVATAEIFRHASHIYVHRIAHGPEEPLTVEMQASLDTAKQLLTMVPDALGPGANLGWCVVVLGAELERADEREYIQSRLDGLHLLGIHNTKNGQRILEEVWTRKDLVTQGRALPERWQDTMQRIGQSQILV